MKSQITNIFKKHLFPPLLQKYKKVMNINMDDFWEYTEKRQKSYLGRIPSEDFWDEAYQLFLEFGSPEELENDILRRETLDKISIALGFN
jgi:hypothetical protein